MALEAVLAAARTRLAAAKRDARKAEGSAHIAVINARWDEVAAIRREVKELEQQAQQQPVVRTAPAATTVPDKNSGRPTLPDPALVAAEIVKRMRAAVSAATAPLHSEIAELRRELAAARRSERQARGKLAAVTSVARPRRVA